MARLVLLHNCASTAPCKTEAATKVGGKWSTDAFSVALQYEDADKRTGNAAGVGGANYTFLAGTYNINANNALIADIRYGRCESCLWSSKC